MSKPTEILTPYEELHRAFILRLCQNKKPVKRTYENISHFVRFFGGTHSGIASIESVSNNPPCSIRMHVKTNPISVLRDKKITIEPQPDYVIDFFFADDIKRARFLIALLSDAAPDVPNAKRSLIHFGCSPDSNAGEYLRNAPIEEFGIYDSFCSIDLYDLADFLGQPDESDIFLNAYAQFIATHANARALKEWKCSPIALSFLCQNNLANRIKEALNNDVFVDASCNGDEATICFTLPDFQWPILREGKCIDVYYGLSLHLHFVANNPYLYVGLAHRGYARDSQTQMKNYDKQTYESLFLGSRQLPGYRWVKRAIEPFEDEFAFAKEPIVLGDEPGIIVDEVVRRFMQLCVKEGFRHE